MDVALRAARPVPGRVLVVGAGPVGLVTALLLRRHGVDVAVVDRGDGPVGESRATDLHPSTLEGLAPYGVTQDLLGIGTRVHRVRVTAGGREVGTIRLGRPGSPWPFALTVPQCTTEGLLQEHLSELGVVVRRRTRVVGLAAHGEGVDVALQDLPTEAYDWVVGCDGAGSAVRTAAGIGFAGVSGRGTCVVADLALDLPLARDEVHLLLRRGGGVQVLPMPVPGYVRLLLDSWPGPPGGSPDPDEVCAVAGERTGLGPLHATHARWTSAFVPYRRAARTMRAGRVLLAGDAAHLVSPVGGQGLNGGVADALLLAPALASVLGGLAPDAVLDHWARRRRAIAVRTGHLAWGATALATSGGALARARDRVAPVVGTRPYERAVAAWLAGGW